MEKKEEILRHQKEKNAELEKLKARGAEDMWLDDLEEFCQALDRVEAQEKDDLEVKAVKKSAKTGGFNVDKFLKRKSGGGEGVVVKSDYLPAVGGERVQAKVDAQLVDKCQKEAQLREVVRAKKEDGGGMSIVDVVSSETGRFSEEQLKQIECLTQGVMSPAKAR